MQAKKKMQATENTFQTGYNHGKAVNMPVSFQTETGFSGQGILSLEKEPSTVNRDA